MNVSKPCVPAPRPSLIRPDSTSELGFKRNSGFLDACIGVAGKGSRTAKNFQRLRSRIRMPGDPNGEAGLVEPIHPPRGNHYIHTWL